LAESNASDPVDEDEDIAAVERSKEATFHEAARERPSRDEAVWATPGTHRVPTSAMTAETFWILKLDIESPGTLAETVRLYIYLGG